MNSSDSSPRHQILVTGVPDPDPRYLLNSHANVKYEVSHFNLSYPPKGSHHGRDIEITRVDLRDADIHRNETSNAGPPKKQKQVVEWEGVEPAPRRVKWSGVDYFCAIHIKKDRVIATYDPRETTFELKGSLALENESDTDIINELVASWVIHEYKAREYMRGKLEPHIYPWTRFDDNYKKYGIPFPDSGTAAETKGAPDYTFTSQANQTPTTSKEDVIVAPEGSLARNCMMTVATSEGNFGPRKMVTPWQDDYQLVRMKDAMTQTDPQPPDY
ncbi:hypothetical protein RSOL_452370, partial [Rhizoctonia solani AG-3 Rhs1AP]